MQDFFSIVTSTFTLKILLLILAGSAFGMLIGAVPGLNVTLAVAIIIPVTFYLSPVEAMALLIAVYKSGIYGGSISAVLLGVPGTPAAAATVKDGHMLSKRGQSGKALQASLYASFFGDIVSNLALILLAAWLAQFALKFGPGENTLLVVFAMVVVSLVSSSSLIKGMLASVIGLSLAIIGMDPMTGNARFTFGNIEMMSGITLIPTLVGLFALSEIYMEYSRFRRHTGPGIDTEVVKQDKNSRLPVREFFSHWVTLIKASLIGVFIGALPGSGAATASFISYSEAKRCAKHPEEFGEGSVKGILAAEAANNAVTGATLIPLLTLGIPGDSITAIMYGALVLQGITPGPLVFTQQGNLITGIFVMLFVCSFFMFALGKLSIRLLSRVLNVPQQILFPIIMVVCFAGSYAINNSMYDVLVMLIAGLLGYLLKVIDLPVAPTLIGFILGTQMEKSILQSLVKSRGSMGIFVGSPIAIGFDVLIVLIIGFYVYKTFRRKKKKQSAA